MKPGMFGGRVGDTGNLRLTGARVGPSAAAVGDTIYVFGGAGQDGFRGDVEAIVKASSDSPSTVQYPPVMTQRLYAPAVAVGDDIYQIGGLVYSGVTGIVEKFHTKTGTVTKCAPMPSPRRAMGAVAVGSFIFVAGGSGNDGKGLPDLYVYDTKNDKWSAGPPMSTGRESCAVIWNGLIVVPGGYDGKVALPICEAYSVAQARWTRLPDMPMATSANHCTVLGNTLFSFGDYGVTDRTLAFDFNRNRWRQSQTQPAYQKSRHNAVVAVGKRVYVIGGNVTSSDYGLDTIQVLAVA